MTTPAIHPNRRAHAWLLSKAFSAVALHPRGIEFLDGVLADARKQYTEQLSDATLRTITAVLNENLVPHSVH